MIASTSIFKTNAIPSGRSGRVSLAFDIVRKGRQGTIALIFSVLLIPITLTATLAIEYSQFIQAQAHLNLAADAAALHAVRVATNAFQNGYTTTATEIQADQTAGQQWFDAQLGPMAAATNAVATVTVSFDSTTGGFTAAISYTASVPTGFGGFLPARLPITGQAGSVSTGRFAEIVLMLDNSASMMIGADVSDILAIEKASVCTTFDSGFGGSWPYNYTWNYNNPNTTGYGSSNAGDLSWWFDLTAPSSTPIDGACDPGYTGDPSLCFYIPTTISGIIPNASGSQCNSGGGVSSSFPVPATPCGFACHSDPNNNDYYGMARSLNPTVKLRLDVMHDAASEVIASLQQAQQFSGQFSVGVFEFNSSLAPVYPVDQTEAGTDLSKAIADVNGLLAPLAPFSGPPGMASAERNTYFPESAQQLPALLTPAGNGASASAPTKNIFIVTDGMNNGTNSGPMTNPSDEQTCRLFKSLGFTVYVLYTTYLPLPDSTYIY